MSTTSETTVTTTVPLLSFSTTMQTQVTNTLTAPIMTSSTLMPTLVTAQGINSSGLGQTPMIAYPLSHLASSFEAFSGNNVARYFERVELRAKIDNLGEAETLKLIKYNLKGEAYDWYKSLPTLDQLSYREFKTKALQRFQVATTPGQALVNLGRCYQRSDEDVASFCTRLRTLGLKVLQEDLQNAQRNEEPGLRKKNDDLVMNQFKIGLRKEIMKDIGVMLVREEGLDLEKAEQLVKIHEMTNLMTNERRTSKRVDSLSKNCTECGRSGHSVQDCYAYWCIEQTNNCFLCGSPDHWMRQCPRRPQPGTTAPEVARRFRGASENNRQRGRQSNEYSQNTGAIPRRNYREQSNAVRFEPQERRRYPNGNSSPRRESRYSNSRNRNDRRTRSEWHQPRLN